MDQSYACLGLKAIPGLLATVRGQLIPLLDNGDLAQLGAIMTRVAEHIEQCGERQPAPSTRRPSSTP